METTKRSKAALEVHSHSLKFHYFPEEIIEEILVRSPVKSLLRFRCVSKSWCSLIRGKLFIKTHFEKSAKDTNLTHHRLFSDHLESCFMVTPHWSLYSLLHVPFTPKVQSESLIMLTMGNYWRASYVEIVDCCRGLCYVVFNNGECSLWNPSTRKLKFLPFLTRGQFTFLPAGFGFDESNDCKVLTFVFNHKFLIDEVVLYSLKTNSWKTVEEFNHNTALFKGYLGKFVNGKIYWSMKSMNSRDIAYFDLENEACGSIEEPKYTKCYFKRLLGLLGERLCVMCDHQQTTKTDFWVLKEQYGMKDSCWAITASIPYLSVPEWDYTLCIVKANEIIMLYGAMCKIYNLETNKVSYRRGKAFYEGTFIHYIPSLISPFLDGEPETQSNGDR